MPEASLRVVGRNDVIFVGDPDLRAGRDDALVYDYGPANTPWTGASLWIDGRAKGAFPGTVVVPQGEHHVEVRAEDGARLLDGYARFDADASVGIRQLEVMVRRERVLQSVRAVGLVGPTGSWGSLWGSGLVGAEGAGALRLAEGPARGLMIGGVIGGGATPGRGDDPEAQAQPRGAVWAGIEAGYGGEIRRLRLRAGWQLRLTGLPTTRLPGPEHDTLPEEAGWMLFSMGPTGQVGVALDRRWTLLLGAALQSSPMRVSPDAPIELHAFGTVSAGLELAL